MTPDLVVPLLLLFASVAVIAGLGVSALLARNSPERRRLRQMAYAGAAGDSLDLDRQGLFERQDPRLESMAKALPKSPKEMTRLRKRLALAGITSFGVAVAYSIAEITLPIVFGVSAFSFRVVRCASSGPSSRPWWGG
jgi:Flp pilus assembly protein TadB